MSSVIKQGVVTMETMILSLKIKIRYKTIKSLDALQNDSEYQCLDDKSKLNIKSEFLRSLW